MTRLTDSLAAALAGMLVGALLVASTVSTRPFDRPWPTSRSMHQPTTPPPAVTTERPSPLPSSCAGASAEGPDGPAASLVEPLPATGMRPAPTGTPRTAADLRGIATWYDHRRGHAAAGPGLRRALGAGWRGQLVEVAADGRSVLVRLTDWCACPGGRVVDLDRRDFAVLAPPSVGVLRVTVRPFALPDTATEDADDRP